MVVRHKPKRRRGERTYHGSHKKWRGGGSRGGRGGSGIWKHKKSYIIKYEPERIGKRGFKPVEKKEIKTINLDELDQLVKKLGKEEIDLTEFGYDKLLGSGKITKAVKIKVQMASKKAIEKVKAVGGEVWTQTQ